MNHRWRFITRLPITLNVTCHLTNYRSALSRSTITHSNTVTVLLYMSASASAVAPASPIEFFDTLQKTTFAKPQRVHIHGDVTCTNIAVASSPTQHSCTIQTWHIPFVSPLLTLTIWRCGCVWAHLPMPSPPLHQSNYPIACNKTPTPNKWYLHTATLTHSLNTHMSTFTFWLPCMHALQPQMTSRCLKVHMEMHGCLCT